MSAETSQTSIPTVQNGAAVSSTYNLFTVGGRYEAAPSSVADGQVRGFQITADGKIVTSAAQSGTWTVRIQDSNGATIAVGQAAMAASLPVVIASNQTAVPASQSGTWNMRLQDGAGTAVNVGQGLMAASLPVVIASNQSALPASQSGNWNMRLNDGAGTSVTVGQKAMASSLPVVIASDQNALPASQSGTWNMRLQDGAGSAVNKGQGAMSASLPVVIASDQSAVPASQSGTWNMRLQDGAGSAVNKGQTTMAGSIPVVIASDQSTMNFNPAGTSSATSANSSVASAALEASHVIKASAGRLYQLTGVNTKASAQYIQVFNSTTVPADTTVPVLLAYVPANGVFSWSFGDFGRYFSTGIACSNSSTGPTKTIGSADCWFNAEFV